ncbi:MAG: dihydropteroate synthase [Candidatus Desantisbacteria bacterium]
MHNIRILNIVHEKDIIREMHHMNVDPQGINLMTPKAVDNVIKLENVPLKCALILKQEMLARGGDAALSKGAIDLSVDATDILLIGTRSQYHKLTLKLGQQYFNLLKLGERIEDALKRIDRSSWVIKCGTHRLIAGKKTLIMGILNITPDSFSENGKFLSLEEAVDQAKRMQDEGADIIDVGGESTRPGAETVTIEEEKRRVLPVIERLHYLNIPISIDTYKHEVADDALSAGACLVNDISGLQFDPGMAGVVARHKAGVVIMHIKGNPRSMQDNPQYKDILGEIISYIREGIDIAVKADIPEEAIIVDPGIGFGKTVEQNLYILRNLSELRVFGLPVLIGTSNKSLIGNILSLPVEERIEGTAATVAVSIMNGASIIRVHDVKIMARVARMTDAIMHG